MSNPIMPEQESLRNKVTELFTVIGLDNGGDGEPDLWQMNIRQLNNLMHLIEQDRERAVREAIEINAAETYKGMGRREYEILLYFHKEAISAINDRITNLTQERNE